MLFISGLVLILTHQKSSFGKSAYCKATNFCFLVGCILHATNQVGCMEPTFGCMQPTLHLHTTNATHLSPPSRGFQFEIINHYYLVPLTLPLLKMMECKTKSLRSSMSSNKTDKTNSANCWIYWSLFKNN